MAYEYDPRRRRRGRVPPQLRAWVFGRRRRTTTRRRRYDPEPRRRYRARRRYDPVRRGWRRPGIWGVMSKLAGFGVFMEQVTSKDRQRPDFQAATMGDKAKRVFGYMIARITGINIEQLGVSGIKQTLNPGGMFNKWLGGGIVMYILGCIPYLPFRGKLKSFGRNIAIGGALGGLFDQPALQTPAYNPALVGQPLIPQLIRRSVWS